MRIDRLLKSAAREQSRTHFVMETLEEMAAATTSGNGHSISLNVFTILWVQKGSGIIVIDLEQYTIENNRLYFLKPGQAFQAVIDEAAVGFIILFSREMVDLYEKVISVWIQRPFK